MGQTQPAIRGVSHNTALSVTSISVNVPVGVVDGDVLIAVIAATSNNAINFSAVAGISWTRIGAQTNNTTGLTMTVFAHRYSSRPGIEPASYSFSTGASSNGAMAVSLVAYSAMAFDVKGPLATTNTASTTVPAPSQTNTSLGHDIVVACYASASASTFSGAPAGYFIEDQVNTTGLAVAIMDTQFDTTFPGGTGVINITSSVSAIGVGISAQWFPSSLTLDVVDNAGGAGLIAIVVDDM